jgi:hypothetical protein
MTGRNENIDHWDPDHAPGPDDLARACAAVRDLISTSALSSGRRRRRVANGTCASWWLI